MSLAPVLYRTRVSPSNHPLNYSPFLNVAPRDRGPHNGTINWRNVLTSLFTITFGATLLAMLLIPTLDPQTPYPGAALVLAVGVFVLTLLGFDTRLADEILGQKSRSRRKRPEEDDK